jgi:hypothetical protein
MLLMDFNLANSSDARLFLYENSGRINSFYLLLFPFSLALSEHSIMLHALL